MMLRTSLYLPFTNFTINNSEGEKLLYQALVQGGPSYNLIVHESPKWYEIREKMADLEEITILTQKQADDYKELSKKFFAPLTEISPHYESDCHKYPIVNLTSEHRRILSYILIAHDYKARIYDDDISNLGSRLSNNLKNNKDPLPQEAISCVEFVEKLIDGYQADSISSLSTNKDTITFKKIMDLLEKDEVKSLSGLSYLFGEVKANKAKLKRDLAEKVTEVLKNKWFPEMVAGATLPLNFCPGLEKIAIIITFLSGVGAKILSQYDFREYCPPIQDIPFLRLVGPPLQGGVVSFSYNSFNDEYAFFVPHH